MKTHLIKLLLIISFYSCKAQTTILALEEKNIPDDLTGVYFKDLNNELNKFEGTWLYQNGNTSLTVTLFKKEEVFNGEWYNDELQGEYQYVENGIEILNYLTRLNDPNIFNALHTIDGNKVVYPDYYPECTDCQAGEKRFVMNFTDLDRRYLNNQILVQHINDNGIEKIKIHIGSSGSIVIPQGTPAETRVPYGEYILIKQ
ncbi:DUF6705 family protein [uncultured Psychroserpens sp.]|uniref:DUF6705 family protein n=1 Tax=uncultured Psychroserpens sp. TaxID=255436 RepID=UPI00260AEA51|nr:DUF6705 family protein [uncultured Psychroserpens sp.]